MNATGNPPDLGRIGSVFSLRTLDEHAAWLRLFLKVRGIAAPSGSAFHEALAAVELLARSPPDVPMDDVEFLSLIRDAIGTDYMIEVLRRAEKWLDTVPSSILRVLRGPDVNLMRSAPQSKERDVAWELFSGAVCAQFAQNVVLEEPDIRCRFRGANWGIAAKLVYSSDPEKHIERIIEGVKQVESNEVDVGVVLINGNSLIPHDDFLRPRQTFRRLVWPSAWQW